MFRITLSLLGLRAGVLIAAIAIGACLRPLSNDCDNGAVCPVGLRCTTAGGTQLCVPPTCGNGQIDRGEACDDGNNVSGDGCPADCRQPCGDGYRDPGEACDDGNTVGGDGCSADCKTVETCTAGDGPTCGGDPSGGSGGCTGHCGIPSGRWSAIYAEPGAGPAAMVYDAARGKVVLFRGTGMISETWEWDGASWQPRNPATLPPPRSEPAIVYDAGRERVVMYGGGGTTDNGVWEWDGTNWTEQLPDASPPLLSGHAMAYDAGRHRVVLFGGATRDGAVQDRTWEWNGTAWQEVMPATRPPARAGHAMAYDSKRGKVVLLGGVGDGGVLEPGDVWEFDGATWTKRTTATGPAPTAHAAMVYDASLGQVVLFGGDDPSDDPAAVIWGWNGAQWTKWPPRVNPEPRSLHGMAYDLVRDRVVMFGGRRQRAAGLGDLGDTWEWVNSWELDGLIWMDRSAAAPSPGALQNAGMVYDSIERTEIVFGGELIDDAALQSGIGLRHQTWQWGLSGYPGYPGWLQYYQLLIGGSDAEPPSRAAFAMASGTNYEGTLVVGGIGPGGQLLNDTWDLDVGWNQDRRATALSPRSSTAMAYDASRRKFVLFGGAGSDGALSDTWEWNQPGSVSWVEKSPAHQPPARQGHAMAFDPTRKRVLLFGGAGDGLLGDTWEWDGTDWTQRTPATSPSPRTGTAMAYDTGRGRLVLFGGSDGSRILDDTWEWDGETWQLQMPARDVPPARRAHAMAFDATLGRVVMFGGIHDDSATASARLLNDMWEWDGTTWQRLGSTKKLPPPRSDHAMAYDPSSKATMVFGGVDRDGERLLDDGWTWDGAQWSPMPFGFPPPRSGHALLSIFGSFMMFGGQDSLSSTDLLDDTQFLSSGSWWSDPHPVHQPPPRSGHAMVFDGTSTNPYASTTMLFGGTGSTGLLSDQWAWNGSDWTAVTPATVPPKRTGFALAYDASRKRVVLFGGQGESSLLGDVWEWDGKNWSDHSPEPVFVPTSRTGHTLVYDDKRQRVVLFGGRSDAGALNDMWEWDGTTWTALPISPQSPPPRSGHGMAYDVERDALVLFGGDDDVGHPLQDTWLFRYDGSGAPTETCFTCLYNCGACHACGDFHCDLEESCSSCPGDCGPCP